MTESTKGIRGVYSTKQRPATADGEHILVSDDGIKWIHNKHPVPALTEAVKFWKLYILQTTLPDAAQQQYYTCLLMSDLGALFPVAMPSTSNGVAKRSKASISPT